jgi:hypothetical protein
MQPDHLQPAAEIGTRFAPGVMAEDSRRGMAVEHRKYQAGQHVELREPVVGMRIECSFHQLPDHGEPERIGAPARSVQRVHERLLREQHLGIVTGARPRILEEALLRQKGRLLVDEVRERLSIDHGRSAPEEVIAKFHPLPLVLPSIVGRKYYENAALRNVSLWQ